VRLLAPLLQDKATDPAVVVVDEARCFAGRADRRPPRRCQRAGRGGGRPLGATTVITTATTPPAARAGHPRLAGRGRRRRSEPRDAGREAVRLDADAVWPLPPLLAGDTGEHVLRVTDRLVDPPRVAVLRPPSLVLGIGASRRCPPTRC
jgi:cobalt-precorrin 5A hydrolase/precorrin-3B C17-methyltransferase